MPYPPNWLLWLTVILVVGDLVLKLILVALKLYARHSYRTKPNEVEKRYRKHG